MQRLPSTTRRNICVLEVRGKDRSVTDCVDLQGFLNNYFVIARFGAIGKLLWNRRVVIDLVKELRDAIINSQWIVNIRCVCAERWT